MRESQYPVAVTRRRLAMIDAQVALRMFYASLFAISAASKTRHPARFVAGVGDYGLVAPRLVPVSAAAVAGSEVMVAFGLVTVGGPAPWIGTTGLLALFAAAQAWSIGRGRSHPCHCFGGEEPIGPVSFGRTIALVLVALETVTVLPEQDPPVAIDYWNTPVSAAFLVGAVAAATIVSRLEARRLGIVIAAIRVRRRNHDDARRT